MWCMIGNMFTESGHRLGIEMDTRNELIRAAAFFYEHAGWSYDPATESPEDGRARCALALAEAEAWAAAADVEFVWDADDDSWWLHPAEDATDGPQTCEICAAYMGREMVASLGCIDDADDNYRRVIEAELAAELQDQVESAILVYA